jgi:hypothetical protein
VCVGGGGGGERQTSRNNNNIGNATQRTNKRVHARARKRAKTKSEEKIEKIEMLDEKRIVCEKAGTHRVAHSTSPFSKLFEDGRQDSAMDCSMRRFLSFTPSTPVLLEISTRQSLGCAHVSTPKRAQTSARWSTTLAWSTKGLVQCSRAMHASRRGMLKEYAERRRRRDAATVNAAVADPGEDGITHCTMYDVGSLWVLSKCLRVVTLASTTCLLASFGFT